MEKQKDAKQVSDLCERIKKNFDGTKLYSHSFDKGFWSKDNQTTLQAASFAILGSVIDTTIKNTQNVFEALTLLFTLQPE